MRNRFFFLARYYIHLAIIMILQKPLFMLFTSEDRALKAIDYWRVAKAGFPMDLSTAGYLISIPFLVVLISVWWRGKFNPRKILRPYHIITALLLSLIFVTDVSLYPFWQFKLDASVFIYVSNPSDAAASVSAGYLIVRILSVLAYAIIIYTVLNRITPSDFDYEEGKAAGRRKMQHSILHTLAILTVGGLIFLAIRGGIKESTMNVGRAYFCDVSYLNHSAVNPAFSLFSSIGKSKDYSKQYRFMEDGLAESILDNFYNQGRDTMLTARLLKSQRPNVLILEMESFGSTYTDPAIYSPSEVTPNYWSIANEAIVFSNFWCNSYRTDRGTLSIFSGYPAFPKTSLMKQPKIVEKLPKMAEAFAKEGYSTHFLYGGDINFTNTKGYLKANGFANLTSDTDFSSAEQHTNKWGVDDAITFRHLSRQLKELEGSWFYGFLTLSSHEPFDVPDKLLEDKVLNSAAYTDRCLGEFIKDLKESPVWDNLLIVILPDHNMLYKREYAPEYFKCRMLWTGGAISSPSSEIDIMMNQSDMAATLLAQLGMDFTAFPFSRNILSPSYSNPSAFCCYNNGFVVADSLGAIAYDLDKNGIAYGEKEASEVQKKTETGKALLQGLYNRLDKLNR